MTLEDIPRLKDKINLAKKAYEKVYNMEDRLSEALEISSKIDYIDNRLNTLTQFMEDPSTRNVNIIQFGVCIETEKTMQFSIAFPDTLRNISTFDLYSAIGGLLIKEKEQLLKELEEL